MDRLTGGRFATFLPSRPDLFRASASLHRREPGRHGGETLPLAGKPIDASTQPFPASVALISVVDN